MTQIFIDESGDLGFSAFSSEYFLVVAVRVPDDKTNFAYSRIIKKVRERVLKKKLKELPELKFSNSSDLIRKEVLFRVTRLNVSIYALIIKKEYTKSDLKENIRVLYNYLIKILLESALREINRKENLFIFLDKCMPFSKIENFEDYIKTEFYSLYSSVPKLLINHDNSIQNGGLQATDFVCGAFGYKYNKKNLESGCDEYTKIIQKRIVLERHDFFKKK
jgi:hypothetical protein